ncbi:MAG: hypothetical protein ABIP50_03720 [Candidatus Saccharimonadales bacterium]
MCASPERQAKGITVTTTINLTLKHDQDRLPQSHIHICSQELFAKLLGVEKFPDKVARDQFSVQFVSDADYEMMLELTPTSVEVDHEQWETAKRLAAAIETVVGGTEFVIRLDIDGEPCWVRNDTPDLPMIEHDPELQNCFDRILQRMLDDEHSSVASDSIHTLTEVSSA